MPKSVDFVAKSRVANKKRLGSSVGYKARQFFCLTRDTRPFARSFSKWVLQTLNADLQYEISLKE